MIVLNNKTKQEQKELSSNVVLAKIEKFDMEFIYEWFMDSEFLKFYDYMPPEPQIRNQVDKTFCDYENNHESVVFAIKLIDNNQIIGIAGFDDIVKVNKVATLFIGLGDKDLRGKGYSFV